MSDPMAPVGGMHAPCCSAHGVFMTCERYRRTHFVEVRPCCSADAEALALENPVSTDPLPDVRRRCRVCLQSVHVYQPTGTKVLRADLHNSPGPISRQVCSGSYGATDDLQHAAREDTATRRWLAGQGIDIDEHLRLKGETQ